MFSLHLTTGILKLLLWTKAYVLVHYASLPVKVFLYKALNP